MLTAPVAEIPPPGSCAGGCLYEPKWDGWRALALCTDDQQPQIRSRNGRRLDPYLPDLRSSIAALPSATALDAEAVAWDRSGRTDFAALQSRLVAGRGPPIRTARHPAYLIVFDALIVAGEDLRDLPLAGRRAALEQLADGPDRLLLCPQTDDLGEATAMLAELEPLGVEGLVIKPAAGRYRGGRRRAGWRKWRARHTTEAVVGGITGTRGRPETLILGRYDADGRLRVVGRTTRLTDVQAAEIAPLLHPPPGEARQRATHPWPQPLPIGWLGRIGQPDALPYRPVEPDLVAEVSTDSAYEAGRWRHQTRYHRYRLDLSPWETPPFRWNEP